MEWNKIKEKLSKGVKEGFDAIKAGAEVTAKKAGEVSVEAKKKIKIHNLKKEIQQAAGNLGDMLYKLEKEKPGVIKNVMALEIVEKIDKLEAELKEVEAQDKNSQGA